MMPSNESMHLLWTTWMPHRPDVVTVLVTSFSEEVRLEVGMVAPGMALLAMVMLLGTGMICAMVVRAPAKALRRWMVSMLK